MILVTDPPVGTELQPPPLGVAQQRLLNYNAVLWQYSADHPGVGLVDLAPHICPHGVPCTDRDPHGVLYRPNDGIHYVGTPTSAVSVWLLDRIVAEASKL